MAYMYKFYGVRELFYYCCWYAFENDHPWRVNGIVSGSGVCKVQNLICYWNVIQTCLWLSLSLLQDT